MKHELEELEEFIYAFIDLYKSSPPETFIPGLNSKEGFITLKIYNIKKELKGILFEIDNESKIENIIQYHQAQIIKLADKTSDCLDGAEIGTDLGNTKIYLCKVIHNSLEDLLTFIETYFSKYFDQSQKIPDAYVQLEKKSFIEKLEEIKSMTQDRNLDFTLTEIIFDPVQRFVNAASEKDISYRRLMYLKQLLRDMKNLLADPPEEDIFTSVFKLLAYLNFNSRKFVIYATNCIGREVKDQISLADQLEKLRHWLKILNQNHVKPCFALKNNNPSVQEQVSIWLTEEINYHEKRKQQLSLMLPPAEPLQEAFKVTTIFSVPQLAFTIRLLKDVGIVTNRNQTELIRFFSKNFGSARNENISAESLRIKYYNVEKSTVSSVQALLIKMVEQTKKGKWFIFYASGDFINDFVLECALAV